MFKGLFVPLMPKGVTKDDVIKYLRIFVETWKRMNEKFKNIGDLISCRGDIRVIRDHAYAESGLYKKCSGKDALKAVRYCLKRDQALWQKLLADTLENFPVPPPPEVKEPEPVVEEMEPEVVEEDPRKVKRSDVEGKNPDQLGKMLIDFCK